MKEQPSFKIIKNGKVVDDPSFDPQTDASDSYIYDVIRIIRDRPLFALEHYQRLVRSLQGVGCQVRFSFEDMCDYIQMLLEANQVHNDNVKVIADVICQKDYDVYLALMHADYPPASAYEEGVDTELFSAIRDNPHVKNRNQALRDATNEVISRNHLFEVILTDDQGCITEGSRSNIFLIRDDVVYTCYETDALQGITRQKIVQICKDNKIELIERAIPAASLGSYDAGFISGTSPKVLPIRRIGDVPLDVTNNTLRRLMKLYDEEVERSLSYN